MMSKQVSYLVEGMTCWIDRSLKLVISLGFLCTSALVDALKFALRRPRPGTCVVLYYHSVAPEHRRRFASQMDLLLRWSQPVSVEQCDVGNAERRHVAVTFDDGLESFVDNALPELRQRMIPATIFIVVQSLGKSPIWMPAPANALNGDLVMSAEQLRELPSDFVTIGSHTLTHPYLRKLDPVDARREICNSRTQLGDILGKEVSLFSFPYGDFNEELVQQCRDGGYDRVFTTLPHLVLAHSREFAVGRVRVDPTDWQLEFCLKVLGAYQWLPKAFAWKNRLKSAIRRAQDFQQNGRFHERSVSSQTRSSIGNGAAQAGHSGTNKG